MAATKKYNFKEQGCTIKIKYLKTHFSVHCQVKDKKDPCYFNSKWEFCPFFIPFTILIITKEKVAK